MVLLLLLGFAVVTFYYAMNATNISVILKDGMAKRAQVIMMGEDAGGADEILPDQLPAARRKPA